MVAQTDQYGSDERSDIHGCVALVSAFWAEVHKDLAHGSRKTAYWVMDKPGFVRWCGIGGAHPESVRASFAERYPRLFASIARVHEGTDGDPRPAS